MDELKIKWVAVGSYAAEANLFGMKFTLKIDKHVDCHRDSYLIESECESFIEPLFAEIKSVGINSAKALAEKIIVEFVCNEMRKANEDED